MSNNAPIPLVDFHCHLDLYPNHEAVFAECELRGIHTLAVTTTPKAWVHNRQLATKTHHVRAGLGLHPQLVAERAHELALWEQHLPETRYVGEVGLDAGPGYRSSIDLQIRVFEKVLRLCQQADPKILSVHSVRTATLVLDMIERHLLPSGSIVVLHWFSGTRQEARRALDLGCYFSINTEMFRNSSQRAFVGGLPLERILTETDGPFCQYQDQPIRPINVSVVVDMVAEARSMKPASLAEAVYSNLRRIESVG